MAEVQIISFKMLNENLPNALTKRLDEAEFTVRSPGHINNNQENKQILSFDNLASYNEPTVNGALQPMKPGEADDMTVTQRCGAAALPAADKMATWKAAANFICDIEGVGLLSLPYAILKGGISSLVALVLVPIICCYTGVILVKCLYEEQPNGRKIRVHSTVEDLGKACWPKYGKTIIAVLQNLGFLMVSTPYLVLSGSFLVHTFPTLPLTERMWIAVGAAVVFPTVFIKSLSKIAWVSLVGIVALIIPIVVVLWYGCSRISTWNPKTVLFTDGEGLAVAFGIIVFSFTAHPALPRLEGCMARKQAFNKVLSGSFFFVTSIKISFAVSGFFTFEGETQEVVVNNFPVNVIYYVVSGCLGLNVLCSYAFPIAIVIKTVQDSLDPESCFFKIPTMLWHVLIRIFLLLVTLLTALLVPHFALLLAFFGSMIASLFSFVFPCMFHLKLKSQSMGICNRMFDYLVIGLGISCAVLGTYFSGQALVKVYQT